MPVVKFSLNQYRAYFDLVNPQYISWDFYKKYIDRKPPFGELGAIIYIRTYSRFINELKRREIWQETILRNIEYSLSLDTVTPLEDKCTEAKALFEMMFNLQGFPAGRSLWTAGSPQTEKDSSSNWNCTFKTVDSLSAFSEIFYWLLIGAGTGFSVEQKYISQLPEFNAKVHVIHEDYNYQKRLDGTFVNITDSESSSQFLTTYTDFVEPSEIIKSDNEFVRHLDDNHKIVRLQIGDSKEDWCNALRIFLKALTNKNVEKIYINYDPIRPQGTPIKTFGGRASGHRTLLEMFDNISYVLQRCSGVLASVDCLDIINALGYNVMAGGVRRCLPKGTLVHLQNGLVPIEKVKVGDIVATSKGYHQVTDFVYQGIQPISQITTQAGIFECTDKHKIAIISDTQGNYIWKQAKDIQIGDRMVFVKNTIPGTETKLPEFNYIYPEHSTTCKAITIPDMSDDIAYLLGFLHGNGYVRLTSSEGNISFAIAPDLPQVVEKIDSIIKQFGVHTKLREPQENDNCYKLVIKSKQLATFLSQFKLSNQTLVIPDLILQGLDSYRAAYTAGVFDADGSVKNRPITVATSVYPEFLKQLQVVLSSLGILTTLNKKRDAKGNWKALHILNLKGEMFIDRFERQVASFSLKFRDNRKSARSQNDFGFPSRMVTSDKVKFGSQWDAKCKQMTVARLEKITGIEVYRVPVEVLSINHAVRNDYTYDISVDSVNEFIADTGYLVHNTAELALGDSSDESFKTAKVGLFSDPAKARVKDLRTMSNNSTGEYDHPGVDAINKTFECLESQGDPGFWIIGNSQKLATSPVKGTNPCAEAALDDKQSCNLTTKNVRACIYFDKKSSKWEYDWELGKKVIELITRVGTRITLAKQWHPEWDKMQKRDRLLGVSQTGIMDAFDLLGWDYGQQKYFFQWCKQVAIKAADDYHDYLGINRSARVCLMKPEGTISLLPTVSSGIHRAYAPYYLRRVRFSKSDPLAQVLLALGLKPVPQNGQGDDLFSDICNTWIFTFPIKTNAKTRAIDEPVTEQLERYRLAQTNYADRGHNISVTVTVAPNEYKTAANWVNDNWDDIIGIAFLPRFDPAEGGESAYPLMPLEPCDKETYEALKSQLPVLSQIDIITKLSEIEKGFEEQELDQGCATGACPIR
jgi:ribonucleotide reductase class II